MDHAILGVVQTPASLDYISKQPVFQAIFACWYIFFSGVSTVD
jgi:hypothetical protein